MLVNPASLNNVYTGFKTSFNNAFQGAKPVHPAIAMTVPSATREETYGWLGQLPRVREWIGDRHVKNLTAHGYTIRNRDFEMTVGVSRNDIEDDQYGVFGKVFAEMGQDAAEHPDQLVFELLSGGFANLCYDGKPFFAEDHPTGNGESAPAAVSNMQTGSAAAWFLIDASRQVRPLVWQERKPYNLQRLDNDTDHNVFMQNKFLYGVYGRGNAGYGFWQLAFASKADLTVANYEAARAAMASLKGDEGRPLNIRATHLVVPPSLEGAGRRIVANDTREAGDSGAAISNEWKGTAELIVSGLLA